MFDKKVKVLPWIEKKIKDEDINYFEYKEFSNRKEIGKGGFGIVYKANWDYRGMKEAALKCLLNNNDSTNDKEKSEEFVKELKLIRSLNYHPNVNQFCGVTKDRTGNYIMVLQYANEGNLRGYLGKKETFDSLEWSDKIRLALDITKGLKCLHDNEIIHRDLHSKNILVNNGKLMIADFGLSKQLREIPSDSLNSLNVVTIGMPGYIDPWCYKNNHRRDKESDIYSLGVLLWEITSGHPPHKDCTDDFLIHRIIDGLREDPIDGTPPNYVKLYKKCWNYNPKQRPDINEVYNTLTKLLSGFDPNPNDSNPNDSNPNDSVEKSTSANSLLKTIRNSISESLKFDFFKMSRSNDEIDEIELSNSTTEVVEGYLKHNRIGTTKNFDFEHILKKNEPRSKHIFNHLKKNSTTQHYKVMIGTCYKKGFGIEINEKESFEWYKKANLEGDMNGHFELGECYYNGIGVEKNIEKALKYYYFAVDEGLNIASYNLAEHHFKCNNSKDEGFKLYKKAAKNGFVLSQYRIAKCYDNGYSKKRNEKKALNWFKKYQENDGPWEISDEIKEVEANNTSPKSPKGPIFKIRTPSSEGKDNIIKIELNKTLDALNEIVEGYLENNKFGSKKNFDFKYILEKYEPRSKHIFNYLKDSEDNPTIKHYEVVIGTCYMKGFGIEKNEKEGFRWYEKASLKDDINGRLELGKCYYNGIGIEKDSKKALELYKLAADGGLNVALYNLAEHYFKCNNSLGTKNGGFKLYKQAAKSGFVSSQYCIAKCYDSGYNKKRNERKALIWFEKYQKNDGPWEISDEIKEVKNRLAGQGEETSLSSTSRRLSGKY